MSTTTTVLGLVKPTIGADTDIWGPMYHTSMDLIDALFTDPTKKMLKLANGGTGADTAAGARTNLGLGALATLGIITTAYITDANVTTAKIADANVTTAKIADANVTAAKLASGVALASGTRALFHQTAAPVGWVKDTTINDKALRVVSGTVGSGGSVAFSSAMANRSVSSVTPTGTVGNTTLDATQIPAHRHLLANMGATGTAGAQTPSNSNYLKRGYNGSSETDYILQGFGTDADVLLSSSVGGGGSHTHSFTGDAHSHTLDMSVQYVDIIIAQKS